MYLKNLRIRNLRNIEVLEIDLAPGLNVFVGANGAGKTSVLEAAHLLSHGKSFRTRHVEHLIRRDSASMTISGDVQVAQSLRRLGLQREGKQWTARRDGVDVSTLTEIFSACAVVCFDPGSHALISGPSDIRRSFIDWGVFHVEPDFAAVSRRFRRALRQRNAVLKQNVGADELGVWDEELAKAAEPLADVREAYAARFSDELLPLLRTYLPELGSPIFDFKSGWNRLIGLQHVLEECHTRDRALGHTTRGPQRADWSIAFELAPEHQQFSRGQEKLCAIACTLAQAQLFKAERNEWPIIALDDLCSELDAAHQVLVMQTFAVARAQVLLTGTEVSDAIAAPFLSTVKFHVEQGHAARLL